MNSEEFEKIIKKKIKIFNKEHYFLPFSKILTEASSNNLKSNNKIITKKLDILDLINSKEKGNHKNIFPWYIIMKIIIFSKDNNNNINLLCYNYLLRLSNIIIKQLLSISMKYKSNLSFCVKIYLKICEEKIYGKTKVQKNISPKKEHRNILYRRITTFSKIPLIHSSLKKEEIKKLFESKRPNSKKEKSKSINDKNNNKFYSNTFLYCNSFTRLFIGDTDEVSVKERYLSNIIVKNEQRLNLHGSYVDLSGGYLKQLYNNIVNKYHMQESIANPENNSNTKLIEIQKAFKKDYKKIILSKKNNQDKTLNNNFSERDEKPSSQPKFVYPSIINYKHINNDKSTSSLTLRKINKNNITNIILKKDNLNLKKNIKKNNLNKKIYSINNNKIDNFIDNTFAYNNKCLSNENSLNNSISKKRKKTITNYKDKNHFNKRLSEKKLFGTKLIFNSINENNNMIYNNIRNNNNLSKNYLDKTDFFFN